LFHLTFIDLQNVGVIFAAPCINKLSTYRQKTSVREAKNCSVIKQFAAFHETRTPLHFSQEITNTSYLRQTNPGHILTVFSFNIAFSTTHQPRQ